MTRAALGVSQLLKFLIYAWNKKASKLYTCSWNHWRVLEGKYIELSQHPPNEIYVIVFRYLVGMYLVALKQKTKKQSKNQTSRQFAVHARNRYTGILGAMFRGLLGEEESSWSDEPLEAFISATARIALMLLSDTKNSTCHVSYW